MKPGIRKWHSQVMPSALIKTKCFRDGRTMQPERALKTMNAFVLHAVKECACHVIYTQYGITEDGTEKNKEKSDCLTDINNAHDAYQVSEILACLGIADREFVQRLIRMLSS